MAHAVVPLNFNMFLEKIVLKDVGSNDADWIRDLRFILIAAQKNYVLNAPLGDRPINCSSRYRRYERLTMLGMMTT